MAYINLFIECSRWRLHFLLLQQSEKRSYCWSWKGKVDVCSWALTTMIAFTFLRMFGHLLYKYLKSNMTTNKEINVTIFCITSYSQTKINYMIIFWYLTMKENNKLTRWFLLFLLNIEKSIFIINYLLKLSISVQTKFAWKGFSCFRFLMTKSNTHWKSL